MIHHETNKVSKISIVFRIQRGVVERHGHEEDFRIVSREFLVFNSSSSGFLAAALGFTNGEWLSESSQIR